MKLNLRWLLPLVGALAVAAWFVLRTDVWSGERLVGGPIATVAPTQRVDDLAAAPRDATPRNTAGVPTNEDEPEQSAVQSLPIAPLSDGFAVPGVLEMSALPVGTLEVEVRVHEHLVGGRVFAQDVDHTNAAADFDPERRREALLVGGGARFDGLVGPWVLVGIELGAEPLHRAIVVLPQHHGVRERYDLGSAHVFGSVRTARGEPIAEAQVWLMGSRTTVVVRSAANGAFDAGTRFPAGDVAVLLVSREHAIDEHRSVRTEPLGEHEVNFGLAADTVRWTGRVIGADGIALAAGDAVAAHAIAVRSKAKLDTAPGGNWFQFIAVTDGRIDHALAPDVYLLTVGDHFATDPVPEDFDLRADTVRDVVVPGFVVVGRLRAETSPATLEMNESALWDRLVARPHGDGAFRFVGLHAGPFELTSGSQVWARGTLAADGPLVVDLGELTAPLSD